YNQSDKLVLLYSGNIGKKQDWQSFIEFCNGIDPNVYEVIVVGDGAKKEWVVERTMCFSNVKHYPPVPYIELSNLLCSADIHLLFQRPEFLDTVMPSKVLGMMASSRPSLIIGHKDSEVNSIFKSIDVGLFFDKYSHDVVIQLDELSGQRIRMEEMGKNARRYVLEHFSKEKVLNNMIKKIESI
ncbi:MAG: glycosyltransferase WbuB, partial [Flavobacteriaceae bacterium]